MKNKESSTASNNGINGFERPQFDRFKFSPTFFVKHGRIEEAISHYDSFIAEAAGDDALVGGLWIHRAHANMEQESFEEAFQDLANAKDHFLQLNGNTPENLILTFDAVVRRLPKDKAKILLAEALTPEETFGAVSEPEVAVVEETHQPPRRVPVPSGILPRVLPVGT